MAARQPFRLILGSSSPARRYLLSRDGYDFEVLPAAIDEPTDAGWPNPRRLVEHIAWLKAEAIAPRVSEGIILTADTVAWLDGQVLGKPADQADARRILRFLGGRDHELWTGVCLWRRPDDLQLSWQELSIVRFKALTDEELDAYLKTRKWENNAGAYAIEEQSDPYITLVRGSLSNVIGLPMESLEPRLRWFADLAPQRLA